MATRSRRRTFTLDAAQELLPKIKALTGTAVEEAEALAGDLRELADDDTRRAAVEDRLNEVVRGWTRRAQELGVDAKGLWLVDFDNGEGYYCWKYPEDSVTHYHGYEEGFAGRMKII